MNKEKKMANEPLRQYIEPTGVLLREYLFSQNKNVYQSFRRFSVSID